ncbi:MAG: hypothetical protein ABWW65_05595 [Thermoprotei archaeon]
MRVKAIVYDHGVKLSEYEVIAINQNSLLVKPVYVYIGLVERIVSSGLETINKPRILGSSGIVRILESSKSNYSELSGKLACVSPLSNGKVLGLDIDGLFSTYTYVKPDTLIYFFEKAKPVHAIYPYIAMAVQLGSRAAGYTVVVGCNILSLAITEYLRKISGVEPMVLCSSIPRYIRGYGVKTSNNTGTLPQEVGSIIVTWDKPSFIYRVLSELNYSKLVLTPLARVPVIPIKPGAYRVEYLDSVERVDIDIVENLAKEFSRRIRVVKISDLSEATELIPPRGLGIVIDMSD